MGAAAKWTSLGDRCFRLFCFGCKVSQYDGRAVAARLQSAGWREVGARAPHELAVIQSCAVTTEAPTKCRQAARRAARAGRRILVAGCAASLADSVVADWPADTLFWRANTPWPAALRRSSAPTDGSNPAAARRAPARTRALLKVQDGCDLRCSYCIVPHLRGPARDRPLAECLAEARACVAAGQRELVVSGIWVGPYGHRGGPRLADLLTALATVPGLLRLRLSSLHPRDLTAELLAVWGAHPVLMPHLHLPLQSGSDRILAAMRRGYDLAAFDRAVAAARAALPQPALSTDLIVGFPGETETDFEQTLAAIPRFRFSRCHVFPYSPRQGTPAAHLPNQIPPAVRRARAQRLRAAAVAAAAAYHQRFLGQHVEIIVERGGTAQWSPGYTRHYVPAWLSPAVPAGALMTGQVTAATAERLIVRADPR
ncbi:MAG: MiaB/RimO family radical SAM methylthiotransferase [Candidatus Marinimicrobia bacterium]|nr:MiaB/RimO family radical SAM methylthiotransferase [Candidatus Neomarinimicrobiota bacterium]